MNPASWQISPAGPADDAALRQLLRESPLHGPVTTTLEREPSFFGGEVDALRHDVALSRCHGEPAACGSRILRRAWWQGLPADTAYLAGLRVHPHYQGRAGKILVRGFRHLEECAARHPAAVTWTAVFENNHRARRTLAGCRAGLPAYHDRGRLLCPALAVPRRAPPPAPHGIHWQTGTMASLEEIASFLTARQRHRPLAPVHTAQELAGSQRWPGLQVDDFILARRGRTLVGVMAVWDQRAVRQVRIQGLAGPLRLVRPLWRGAARLAGWPALPADGTVLAMAHAAFLAVADDSPALARLLLLAGRAAAAARHLNWLCLCLHESDPLTPALRGLPSLSSHGRLYQVSRESTAWPEGSAPVIESATL